MPAERYDVIIIGSGAGGGTLAHTLAPTGLKIAVLERGDYLPREKQNWDPAAVFIDERYHVDEYWLDNDGKRFRPQAHYYVGGNTKVYGAALFRYRESDFHEKTTAAGISPAWPISYNDLAPYYTRAEHLYTVHGQRNSDPTEPPSDDPYPFPPIRHEPRIAELRDHLQRKGVTPFPLPMGLMLDEDDRERSPCIKCDTCDGFPCLVRAKADAHVVGIAPALQHPNVTLRRNARVVRLETSPSGREVTNVVIASNGAEERVAADVVVVAGGAVQSAALLLRSANDQHRAGVANGSGVVGRHYMAHNNSAAVAVAKKPNPTRFQKTLGVNDYYEHDDAFGFALGHIQMLGKTRGDMFRGDAPPLTPQIVLDTMASHGIDFWMTTEDLPDPENRVEPNADGTITLRYRENNTEAHAVLIERWKSLVHDFDGGGHPLPDMVMLSKRIPLAGTGHQCGTVRFGTDPATSALDVDCKAHELDNLYVVDASCFVSSGAVNPGLTVIANALRVGDHLANRFGKRTDARGA